jgi:hypothetical protein
VSGNQGFLRRINQTEVDNFYAISRELFGNLTAIAFKVLFEASELRPVGLKADTE